MNCSALVLSLWLWMVKDEVAITKELVLLVGTRYSDSGCATAAPKPFGSKGTC